MKGRPPAVPAFYFVNFRRFFVAPVLYFAQNLVYLRQERGYKPEEMARLLGIWEDTLRRYEMRREEPGLDVLLTIADKLNLTADQLLRNDLEGQQKRLRREKVRLIVSDVDGTLTDGSLYYGENGEAYKRFHVHDGWAIHRLGALKLAEFAILSAGSAEAIVKQRAKILGVSRVYVGPRPKARVAEGWMAELGLNWKQVAYVGDDLNDLEAMQLAGISACPQDAPQAVRQQADIILSKSGGTGCIREFIEHVLGFNLQPA